jgi:hypothetical protein
MYTLHDAHRYGNKPIYLIGGKADLVLEESWKEDFSLLYVLHAG